MLDPLSTFAANLRTLRKERGPSQERLRSTIGALPEAGTTLGAIASEIGVPTARLARMFSVPEDHDTALGGIVAFRRSSAVTMDRQLAE